MYPFAFELVADTKYISRIDVSPAAFSITYYYGDDMMHRKAKKKAVLVHV